MQQYLLKFKNVEWKLQKLITKITKKSCCKDELEVVKGQDQLKLSKFEDLYINQILIVASFVYTYNTF